MFQRWHCKASLRSSFVIGRAPDIGGDAVSFREDFLRAQGLVDDRPAAEDVRLVLFAFRRRL